VPLIPRALLFANPTYSAPDLSPDGTRLAYLAPSGGALNVWVRTLGEDDDRVLTHDTHRGILAFTWAENGELLLYLQDLDGDENWHLYAIPVEGGEPHNLTPFDGAQARFMGLERSFEDEVLIGLNDRVAAYHDLYRINVRTGERTLVVLNDIDAGWITADHLWQARLAMVSRSDGAFVVMERSLETGEWSERLAIEPQDSVTTGVIGFAGDNRTAYLLSSIGANTTELGSLDLQTGEETRVFGDPHYDVSDVLLNPLTYALEGVQVLRERAEWTLFDPTVAEDFEALRALHAGELSVIDRDHADENWLVEYYEDTSPAVYYHYHRPTREGRFLFAAQPDLEGQPLAPMRPISYTARDGLVVHGYLTQPLYGAPPHPLVLLVHGGPWARDAWGYDPLVQWLANRGYAVLQPNFRGSTGYGKAFVNAGDREWGRAMQDDLSDAVAWAVAEGVTRADSVCIFGASYGGYATLAGLTFTPDLYACGVDLVGPSNLFTLLASIPPYWESIRMLFYARVGDPERDVDLLRAASPLFHVERLRAPLLIGQGANDPRVAQAESDQIVAAMQERGIPVTYALFGDEGHGFQRDENQRAFVAIAEAFLATHLGGRFEPFGDDFDGSSLQLLAGTELVPGLPVDAGVEPNARPLLETPE
jgi:dipeptidyl aminopeptidase/acylaminoacyl peptidase